MLVRSIERAAGFFILAWGWKRAFLAFAAGALSALSMPPFDLFPVLFLTFPAFVWIMDGVAAEPAKGLGKLAAAFSAGWWFGFGYFLVGMWWVGNALLVEGGDAVYFLPVAILALPAALAIYWGVAAALAQIFWIDGWRRPVVLAAALASMEFLRGALFTGLPWNAIGYAAMPVPVMMQKASVLGLWGVTLLAIAVFASPSLLAPRIRPGQAWPVLFAAALVAADVSFGFWRLAANPPAFVDGVSLRVVQPAIDQAEKWSPDLAARNFRTLLDLSTAAVDGGMQGLSGTDLLLWPETAFPFVLTVRRDALAELGAMLPDGTLLVAGAIRVEPPAAGRDRELAFNSVYTIDPDGQIVEAADKTHLVPFGEYLPFRELLELAGFPRLARLDGGLESGPGRVLLDGGPAGLFLPLICYEIIFPVEANHVSPRPGFIVNVTNDAWFGYSPGPFQHHRQAVLRGVEAGLPVVRSANNGISSVTDGAGRRVASLGLGQRGAFDAPLPAPLAATPFSRFGNAAFFTLAAFFFVLAASGLIRRADRH